MIAAAAEPPRDGYRAWLVLRLCGALTAAKRRQRRLDRIDRRLYADLEAANAALWAAQRAAVERWTQARKAAGA